MDNDREHSSSSSSSHTSGNSLNHVEAARVPDGPESEKKQGCMSKVAGLLWP